jgi:hypothetical protein
MTTLTTSHDPSPDARQVPRAPRRRLWQDAAAAPNSDLPSAHHTTIRNDAEGRAA